MKHAKPKRKPRLIVKEPGKRARRFVLKAIPQPPGKAGPFRFQALPAASFAVRANGLKGGRSRKDKAKS